MVRWLEQERKTQERHLRQGITMELSENEKQRLEEDLDRRLIAKNLEKIKLLEQMERDEKAIAQLV